MSLYSLKKGAGGAVQPWSQVITLAEAGKGCDGLFNLYDSLGDKTLIGANTIATLLDGPEKVVRYGALTLGDGATATSLSASQRCKGLVILCDSLTVKANATLNMTGKGARVLTNDDPFFPFIDYEIPFKIGLDSSRMSLLQTLAVIKSQGLAPWDRGTFQHLVAGMYGFNLGVALAGATVLMVVAGCGDGGASAAIAGSGTNGNTGVAGASGGMGGGGSGAVHSSSASYSTYSCKAGKGSPYSGGSGSGGNASNGWLNAYYVQGMTMGRYSGQGGSGGAHYGNGSCYFDSPCGGPACGSGGAGNPGGYGAQNSGGQGVNGGDGTGGKLTIICRGTITIQSGGKIEANGIASGAAAAAAPNGGGSGGGHVSLIYGGSLANSGTTQAAGGSGGTVNSYFKGGDGGAGSVVTKTFSGMGW